DAEGGVQTLCALPLPALPHTDSASPQPVYTPPRHSALGDLCRALAAAGAEVFLRQSRVPAPDFHGTSAHGGRSLGPTDPAPRPAPPRLRPRPRWTGRRPAGGPVSVADQPPHLSAAGGGGPPAPAPPPARHP